MSEERKLEIARNAATNGRLVCAMLFAACLTMVMIGHHTFMLLAVLSVAPVASSYAADLFVRSLKARRLIGMANIATLAFVTICLLFA